MRHFKAVWWSGNGYAWQDDDFLDWKHPIARRCAQRWMLFVGITMCGMSSWEHPCIKWRWWRREEAT